VALYLPTKYPSIAAAKDLAPFQGKIQLALLTSSAYLIVLVVGRIGRSIKIARLRRKAGKRRTGRLHYLTHHEKQVLQAYICTGRRTVSWDFFNPNVASLVAYGILFATISTGNMFQFPFDITDEAWNYLNAHPELILAPRAVNADREEFQRMLGG